MPFCRLVVLLSLPACLLAAEPDRPYEVTYHASFLPGDGEVAARVRVEQPFQRLIELNFNAPESRYRSFEGDGEVKRKGRRLIWRVPREGGELHYRVKVDHERSGAFDARLTEEWAVGRLDDLFPPARVRSRVHAYSDARLHLIGPEGWSIETRYGPVGEQGVPVDSEGRRFDRPLGWFAAGDLGIRRARIAGRRIAIAGPRDQGFRRMDMLTFLHWTLPELARIAPSLPQRIVVVGGSRDMWRGGLSGPGSLYVHPERPLVSGNATSTLLHELIHVAMEEPSADGADWIVEGLAEYYSLVILLRTGGISGSRFQRSLDWLEQWARSEDGALSDPSTGADTARAALLFRDLDLELRHAGESLDAVASELLSGRVSIERLEELVATRLPERSRVLARALRTLGQG